MWLCDNNVAFKKYSSMYMNYIITDKEKNHQPHGFLFLSSQLSAEIC